MDPREFVETRTRRYMAQALEEFEERIEQPLDALRRAEPSRSDIARIVEEVDGVKRTFRRKLQALAGDCIDLMPSDLQINGFEPVRRTT